MGSASGFRVVCPKCEAKYRLPPGGEGKRFKCAKCRTVFQAPDGPGDDGAAEKEPRLTPVKSNFPDAPPIGKVIGDCQIVDLLGEGGMGIVYKAVRRMLKRIVALKVLPKSISDRNPSFAERFLTEAQLAAGLDHNNIVRVYNVGKDGDHVFMEMEFIQGTSLASLIKGGPLSEREATRIIVDAATALARAHERGIVHRDVKPENILLTNEGAVKVTDFGLAGNVWDKREKGLTADAVAVGVDTKSTGSIMGTPKFMSPQQCRGEPVDGRTDVYALGATFYSLLCGHPPFDDKNIMVVLTRQQEDALPDIRQLNPNVSERAWNVIKKAMAKELSARYATCGDIIQDLTSGEEGGPGGMAGSQDFWNSFSSMMRGVRNG